jgi:hypothetical protein
MQLRLLLVLDMTKKKPEKLQGMIKKIGGRVDMWECYLDGEKYQGWEEVSIGC